MAERYKLDRRPSNETSKLRRGKVICLLHDNILKGDTNGLNQKNEAQKITRVLETIMESKVQKNVLFKGSIYFKLLQIGLMSLDH